MLPDSSQPRVGHAQVATERLWLEPRCRCAPSFALSAVGRSRACRAHLSFPAALGSAPGARASFSTTTRVGIVGVQRAAVCCLSSSEREVGPERRSNHVE